MSDLFELDACDVAKIALEVPEIAALADSDQNKKELVSACVEACGSLFNGFSCPYVSEAEQDRTLNHFALAKMRCFRVLLRLCHQF